MPETDANAPAGGKVPIAGGIDLFGKYEVGKLLGCGAFAKVYRARDTRTGKSVAIKAVSKQKLLKNGLSGGSIKREISIMRRLRHPHIVRLHEVLATKTKVYFVMEYAKSGELFTRVARGRFTEELSRRYFQQLISAIGFCHSRGVFHRDLKPENLLLDENSNLKVSDFGLSAVAEQIRPDGLLHTLCGTPAYVAPEILAKKGYDGAKVDVWSCGVVLYVLAAGYLPFNDTNLMAMYRKIYEGQYRCPRWTSPELRRFLSRLLDPNPETRITVHEIVSDPWFTKGYIENKFKFYRESEEEETFESKGHGHGHSEGDSNKCLNAFDIILFSPGLDLSVLFEGSGSVTGGERFVSVESPEKILEKVEEIALGESVTVTKGRGRGLKLEGHDGSFTVLIEVYRLTDRFSVVEMMRKRRGGAVDSQKTWEDRIQPLIIRRLIHQPEVPVSRP